MFTDCRKKESATIEYAFPLNPKNSSKKEVLLLVSNGKEFMFDIVPQAPSESSLLNIILGEGYPPVFTATL